MPTPVQCRFRPDVSAALKSRSLMTQIPQAHLIRIAVERLLSDYTDAQLLDLECEEKKRKLAERSTATGILAEIDQAQSERSELKSTGFHGGQPLNVTSETK
jgi:hypothetical protein